MVADAIVSAGCETRACSAEVNDGAEGDADDIGYRNGPHTQLPELGSVTRAGRSCSASPRVVDVMIGLASLSAAPLFCPPCSGQWTRRRH
jgi:hypothetical protein